MDLSLELKNYLLMKGANKVGFADIANITPKKGLNNGVVFYLIYPREIIANMENAPTPDYLHELIRLNSKLDEIGMLCEEFLIDKGYRAYAQTKQRWINESNLLPHKTIATRANLGWIGKSALFITTEYGSALRLSSVLTDAPLKIGKPIFKSRCGECMECTKACPGEAIIGLNWNYKRKHDDFFDNKRCRDYALKISKKNLGKADTICGKCIFVCPYTQKYIKKS